jgi:RNA polymerase sigma-70 factor (ECF subfamily)
MKVPSPNTSVSLLEQVRDPANAGAWPTLVGVYTPVLHAWLSAAGLQSADRDDITQRVLEVLVRRLPEFRHNGRTGAFRAWLRGMTANFLKEFWRGRPTPTTDSVLEQLSDPDGRLSRIWDRQHDQHVYQSLAALVRREVTETTWLAFHRTAIEDKPAKEVAVELGLSVNAVLIARSRVLTRLRKLAAELLD